MAKKTKIKKTLVEQILTKAKIEHEGLIIEALKAGASSEFAGSKIYKTLALKGDKTGPLIGIIPLDQHLSEKKLAKASANKKVAMIPQKELEKTTGYVHGANNPVGIRQKHAFPIFIEQTALTEEKIIVSAGELGRSIAINPRDLADFVEASFADILAD
ncbi:aminoacyl-tRNA deacylase [Streptococcus oricebi]|uniref:Cys-tRNA(Pro)/Cys-tRNA(Cys) deacylase n=1 Tax=Streptococcus oricebi TaxID=1547447 RepID=A0ABS5B149_9STRE|nr:aminoacyl-tRNA deacylase [Streptococcus oricebi]MBP2622554.1 aminoacyl-tRNA deacylase [Streptococcus oricebi]